MNLIRTLYSQVKCYFTIGGEKQEGFDLQVGIRQGCPLSPLIFAIVADILLRKLARTFPDDIIRAYADDTAMVISDTKKCALIAKIFDEYGRISGLKLNLKKTILIPLFQLAISSIQEAIKVGVPLWKEVLVQDHGTYLGFVVGWGRKHKAWDKPMKKFKERARAWGNHGLGMQYTALAYRIYILPVLQYVGQLERCPPDAGATETEALKHLLPGPSGWFRKSDLFVFKEVFHQAT